MAKSSISTPGLNPDQQQSRSKSCETACSSNSSCFFQRRKPINPLANSLRSGLSRSTPGNSVKQRVLSAKLLKVKSLQNQLNDANYHLAEVIRENKALKNLQKRQDKALTKYEGENAELPRLIKSHEEEIRFLTEKNRQLRKTIRELNEQLKHRNEEIINFQEQLKHFEELDKDKHLLERGKLIEELDDYKMKLSKAENEIVVLNRKLMLEIKASKQRLNAEMSKHKLCQKELTNSLSEIMKLNKIVEDKEKQVPFLTAGKKHHPRFSTLIPTRQSMSMISLTKSNVTPLDNLNKNETKEDDDDDSNDADDKVPVTDVKLQPISNCKAQTKSSLSLRNQKKGILKCPSENIKARLSSSSSLPINNTKESEQDESNVEKLSDEDNNNNSNEHQSVSMRINRPTSSKKLDKIEMNLQNTIKKVQSNKDADDVDHKLGNYCLQAIDSVKTYTNVIDNHRENIQAVKADTDILLQSLQEIDNYQFKLDNNELNEKDEDDPTNLDFVTQILSEELEFKKKYKSNGNSTATTNGGLTDKKKLLAKLRAIDNGDVTIDSFDNNINNNNNGSSDNNNERKNKLLMELFGENSD